MREVCSRSRPFRGPTPPRARWRFYADAARLPRRSAPVRRRQVPLRAPTARSSRQLLRARTFDAVVCDFLPPVVNLPERLPCPAILFTHNVEAEIWRRHAEQAANPVSKYLHDAAVAAHAALRAARAVALRPGARGVGGRRQDVRAPLSGRLEAPVHVVQTGVETDYFTPTRPRPERARTWSSPARWTGCRTKTA